MNKKINFIIDYLNSEIRDENQVLQFIDKWFPRIPLSNLEYIYPKTRINDAVRNLIDPFELFVDNDAYYSSVFNTFCNHVEIFCTSPERVLPVEHGKRVLAKIQRTYTKNGLKSTPDPTSGEWLQIILYDFLFSIADTQDKARIHWCPFCSRFFFGRPNKKYCCREHRETHNNNRNSKRGYFKEYMKDKRKHDHDYKTYYADYRK